MSDKKTAFGQYNAQGGKDGDDKSTVTRESSTADNAARTASIQPAPKVK